MNRTPDELREILDGAADAIADRIAEKLRPLRVLRVKDAAAKLGVSKSHFYDVCKLPGFPRRVHSAATGVAGWFEHELDDWMRESYK